LRFPQPVRLPRKRDIHRTVGNVVRRMITG
jgi:hypothetical protein